MKLTFEEYLKSKETLLISINRDPKKVSLYEVVNYCKLSHGVSRSTRSLLSLKPSDIIKISWNYKDRINPVCESIKVNNMDLILYWPSEKLQQWLDKNSTVSK